MAGPAQFLAAADDAADAAGAVLRRYFRTAVEAEVKADLSPVTVADRQAELVMREVLTGAWPDHPVLGEEGGWGQGAAPLEGARYRWAIDPIDGTRAFMTGRPTFGTLIALLDGDVPVLGVIDQAISGERWVGCAGRRTVFRGGSGAVGTRLGVRLGECEVSCTSPGMFDAAEVRRWEALARCGRRASYGGDCYAYGLLALGVIDVVAEAGMKLWDWAALMPVVEGAGGRLTGWDGEMLSAARGGAARVLAVGDPALLGDVVECLALGPEQTRDSAQ